MQNGLRRLQFERSGGSFPLSLKGTVDFDGPQGHISAVSLAAMRPLSAEERTMFARLDIPALRAWGVSSSQMGQPDRYQYDVTLDVADGAPVSLRFYENSIDGLKAQDASLGDLAAWVRSATTEIWKQKIAPRP